VAAALADTDPASRERLAAAFRRWHGYIRGALKQLRTHSGLPSDAELDTLATSMLAAIEGGPLLAKTLRTSEPLRVSLHVVVRQLRESGTASHAGSGYGKTRTGRASR
jgi:TetR/AcrR family transcriptional repressor of nem operon